MQSIARFLDILQEAGEILQHLHADLVRMQNRLIENGFFAHLARSGSPFGRPFVYLFRLKCICFRYQIL